MNEGGVKLYQRDRMGFRFCFVGPFDIGRRYRQRRRSRMPMQMGKKVSVNRTRSSDEKVLCPEQRYCKCQGSCGSCLGG